MAWVLDRAWKRLNDVLFETLGPERYALWIRNARPAWLDEEALTVHVENGFARDKMERIFLGPVSDAARRITNRNLRVRFEADRESFPTPSPARLRDEGGEEARATFTAFVAGPGNRMALAAAQAFVEGFPRARSLLVCARSGLGKSHLVGALAAELARRSVAPVLSFTGEQFRRHFAWAFHRGHAEAFLHKCRSARAFLLDGLQLLAGRPEALRSLAEVLAAIDARGGRTAVTTEVHPREMEGLPSSLRARFRARIETSIGAPDPATSRAVLAAHAPRGTPESTLDAIARAVTSSHKDQLYCLARALELGPATPSAVRAVLGEFLSAWSRGLTYADIARAVAETFGVTAGEIYSDDRSHAATEARQACYYLARRILREPFARIGDHFGGRDHSTVLEACRKLERRRRPVLRKLEETLNAGR